MSLVAAFLMLNNVETYYQYIHETKSTRAKIAQIEDQARKERDSERATVQRMRGLDLNRLDRQTKFINAKLAERAFSWSTLLDELESVLADDVRLMSVSPAFGDDGRIALSLSFETKSGDGMTTTINRMNADPQFEEAFPHNESALENGNYAFNITAQYLPPGLPAARGTEVRR
jgi:hypothetical protein